MSQITTLGLVAGLTESIYYMLQYVPPYSIETAEILYIPRHVGELTLLQDVVVTYQEEKAKGLIQNYLLGNREIVVEHIIRDWYKNWDFNKLPRYLNIDENLWHKIKQQKQKKEQDYLQESKTEYIDAKNKGLAQGLYALFQEYKKPSEYVFIDYLPMTESIRYLIEYIIYYYNLDSSITLIDMLLFGKTYEAIASLVVDAIKNDREFYLFQILKFSSETEKLLQNTENLSVVSVVEILKERNENLPKSEIPEFCRNANKYVPDQIMYEKLYALHYARMSNFESKIRSIESAINTIRSNLEKDIPSITQETLLPAEFSKIVEQHADLSCKELAHLLAKRMDINMDFQTSKIRKETKFTIEDIVEKLCHLSKYPLHGIAMIAHDPFYHNINHSNITTDQAYQHLNQIKEIILKNQNEQIEKHAQDGFVANIEKQKFSKTFL